MKSIKEIFGVFKKPKEKDPFKPVKAEVLEVKRVKPNPMRIKLEQELPHMPRPATIDAAKLVEEIDNRFGNINKVDRYGMYLDAEQSVEAILDQMAVDVWVDTLYLAANSKIPLSVDLVIDMAVENYSDLAERCRYSINDYIDSIAAERFLAITEKVLGTPPRIASLPVPNLRDREEVEEKLIEQVDKKAKKSKKDKEE